MKIKKEKVLKVPNEREITYKDKEEVKSFVELANEDYELHVGPIRESLKTIDESMRTLHYKYHEVHSQALKSKIINSIDELNVLRPKLGREYSILSIHYQADYELSRIASELDSLDGHNATVDVYMQINEKIKEHIVPLTDKLIRMYGGVANAPHVVNILGAVQKECKSLKMKDRTELEKKFYDIYNKIKEQRKQDDDYEETYKDILKDVLEKIEGLL